MAFYEIDRDDLIVAIDAEWDAQAQANGAGPRCATAAVLGRPLLDFIVGDATRMFVRAAVNAARVTRQTRVLPYRCDGPSEYRRFEMVISPLGDGRVRVEHVLVSAEPRKPGLRRLVEAGHMAGGWRCSQCLSVKLAGGSEWLPPESVETTLLAADVCPRCEARLASPRSAFDEGL